MLTENDISGVGGGFQASKAPWQKQFLTLCLSLQQIIPAVLTQSEGSMFLLLLSIYLVQYLFIFF